MNNTNLQIEYKEKIKLKSKISDYYQDKVKNLFLEDFSRIKAYLPDSCLAIDRNIIFAHRDFELIAKYIAEKKEYIVVSGLNPSSPLHLGHKVLFDFLL
jgi:tryptophanyl-tRNA synthetase